MLGKLSIALLTLSSELCQFSVCCLVSCVALSKGFLDSLSHFEYFAVTFV